MISRMMQTVNATDSLYLSPAQQKDVLDYAKSMPRRFAACRAVEAAEDAIVAAAGEAFFTRHPGLADIAENGWENFADDQRLALRTAVQAMLLDDPAFPEGKFSRSLRRTLTHLEVTAAAQDDWFASLRSAVADRVPPDAADALAPYLDALAAKPQPSAGR